MQTLKQKTVILVLLISLSGILSSQAGILEQLFYDGITGVDVADLRNDGRFPNQFDDFLPYEIDSGFSTARGQGDDFGSLTTGYIQAPASGTFTIFVASDDGSELLLSSNADPANAELVAFETGCCTALFGGDRLDERSNTVDWVAGGIYYFEAVYKEGGGGDWMDVGWERPDGTQEVIPSAALFPATQGGASVSGAPVFDQAPFDVFGDEGGTAEFVAHVSGAQPMTFQWQKNGTDIAGETLASYVIDIVSVADDFAVYTVDVTNDSGSASSFGATIFVAPDSTPPEAKSAGSRGNPNGVSVIFSEPVTEASATNKSNYSIDGGAVTIESIVLSGNKVVNGVGEPGTTRVTMVTSGDPFVEGSDHSIRISNIQDRAATPNTFAAVTSNFSFGGGVTTIWDFDGSLPAGSEVAGVSEWSANEGVDGSGALVLTRAVGSALGGWLSGEIGSVSQINITFDIYMDDGTATQADGVSMAITDSIAAATAFGEEGAGDDLNINFDNWDNGGSEAPAIDITWGGRGADFLVATVPMGVQGSSTLDTEGWWPVTIDITGSGDVTLTYNGETIHDGVNIPNWQTIDNARVAFGARTGGANANQWIDNFTYNLSGGSIGPVGISEEGGQPVDLTIDELGAAVFTVIPTGAGPFTYQWSLDGAPIDGATRKTYIIANVRGADEGVFSVELQNEFSSITSSEASLTVILDTDAPEIANVEGSGNYTTVVIDFDEEISADTATDIGNFQVIDLESGNAIGVSAVSFNAPAQIVLTTDQQIAGQGYGVIVNGVKNLSAAGKPTDNATGGFAAWREGLGGLSRIAWAAAVGNDLDWYPVESRGKGRFDTIALEVIEDDEGIFVPYFETPNGGDINTNPPGDVANDYAAALYGFLIPKESGRYRFAIASDDPGALYLSTDEDPANSALIASEPVWNGIRAFAATDRRDPDFPENVSDTLHPDGIQLEAGSKYYVEAFFKEGGGGDNLAVTWKSPGDDSPFEDGALPIAGEFLSGVGPVAKGITVTSISPAEGATGVNNSDNVEFVLNSPEGGVPLNSDSVVVRVNGAEVAADITADGNTTTVTYTPDPPFGNFENVTVTLDYSDAVTNPGSASVSFESTLDLSTPGTVFIEAEDFDFDGGQWLSDVSNGFDGPYAGGAYDGLGGIQGIDFDGAGATRQYRTTDGDSPSIDKSSAADDVRNDRGSFTVETNWIMGWNDPGDWTNYTRDFGDSQTYSMFASMSSGGGDINSYVSVVTAGAGTADQTLEQIGSISGLATGNWDVFAFYQLRDDDGNGVVTELAGLTTLQVGPIDGNQDYNFFAFIPATAAPE
ncbi:MAG TPA: hypothetical protein EYG38_15410, partial [Verrucomicrobia bacterium]|nr:hypothetical protein [Verrucomicrobiota bacterium]